MSATNRGTTRRNGDAYYTPRWSTLRAMDLVGPLLPPLARLLEPAVGAGDIVGAVDEWLAAHDCPAGSWATVDLDAAYRPTFVGDYVRGAMPPELRGARFDACIGNPPFSDADAFVREALRQCDRVLLLLRLNWLSGGLRSRWLREHTPDTVLVLPNRPDFTGGGGDATDYAWMGWGFGLGLRILDTTPPSVRAGLRDDPALAQDGRA